VAEAAVRLIARNNEVLATAKSDAHGYVRFAAGQTHGEGGFAPAILVAENGAGEYAFLDLTTNAFDLSDRGVKGREAPGPLDGFLYTERGVYRPGEEVNLTALVRDQNGLAASLPATLILLRPDGVEYGRYPLTDLGLGGRSLRVALAGSAMTGTWRAKLHADPADDPITQATFLVEDYTPERLDLTLEEGGGILAPDETKTIKVAGRYLYGPPAAGLAVEGDIIVKPSAKDLDGYPGYSFGQADETVAPASARRSRSCRRRATPARPRSRCGSRRCRAQRVRSRPMSSCVCVKRAGAPLSARSRCLSTCASRGSASSRCSLGALSAKLRKRSSRLFCLTRRESEQPAH
jgi:uncharacterized protein YfaS (alpha-2-macroglobulin family)